MRPPRSLTKRAAMLTLFTALVFLCSRPALSQTANQNQGIPWNAVQVPVPHGFVSALTGQIHLEIPLASVPQRNFSPLIMKFVYDSSPFYFDYNTSTVGHTGPGWRIMTGTANYGTGFYNSSSQDCTSAGYAGSSGTVTTWTGFGFQDFNGTNHQIVNSNVYTKQVNCTGVTGGDITSTQGVTSDGSGYVIRVSNYYNLLITAPDGTIVYDSTGANGFQWPKDTNGNYVEAANGSDPDTLGRSPITGGNSTNGGCTGGPGYWRNPPPPTSSSQLLLKVSDGSTGTYTLNCTDMSMSDVINGTTYTAISSFPTSLVLPNGTQYTFAYDTGSTGIHTGDLFSVTLPTGGTVQFTHVAGDSSVLFGGRVTSATFGGGTWNFNYSQNSSNLQITTTLTGPPRYDSVSKTNVSDQTVFTSNPYPSPPSPPCFKRRSITRAPQPS